MLTDKFSIQRSAAMDSGSVLVEVKSYIPASLYLFTENSEMLILEKNYSCLHKNSVGFVAAEP